LAPKPKRTPAWQLELTALKRTSPKIIGPILRDLVADVVEGAEVAEAFDAERDVVRRRSVRRGRRSRTR